MDFKKKKIKNSHNLKIIKKNIKNVKLSDFKNVDIVCDLNGISNDPSSELNPKHTWDLNYNHRINFAKMAKKQKSRDTFLIQHVQFMAITKIKFMKTEEKSY